MSFNRRPKMAAQISFKQNLEIIASIDCMVTNFQERFQEYVSSLKQNVNSANRTIAEKIFLSALTILSFKFPDPTEKSTGGEEETTHVLQELNDLKAQICQLNHLQEQVHENLASVIEGTTRKVQDVKDETKRQIQLVKMGTEMEIQSVKEGTKREIRDVKEETKREIQDVKEETKREIQDVNEETKREIQDVKEETKRKIRDVKEETKREIQDVKDGTQKDIYHLEKQAESSKKSLSKEMATLKDSSKSFQSGVREKLNKLSESTMTNAHNVKGLRKLQSLLQRRNQAATDVISPPATAAATTEVDTATASPTQRGPPNDAKQRISFPPHCVSDDKPPDIYDAKLLPGGFIILVDYNNTCIKLFDKQGRNLHIHTCQSKPYRLAVIESDCNTKSSQVAVSLPESTGIEFLKVTAQQIKLKRSIETSAGYRALAAIDSNTLAAGYFKQVGGVDIIDTDGHVFRRILSDAILPWFMVATPDGDLVWISRTDTMARLKVSTGAVLFNVTVPQIANPYDIIKAQDGFFIVTDCVNRTSHLITSKGHYVKQMWKETRTGSVVSVSLDNGTCLFD